MNIERRSAIIRLLESRDDHLPEPTRRVTTATGFAGGVDAKGKPLRSVSCPDCLANGKVMFSCETCGGSGEIPDPGKDPMDDPIKNPPPDPRRKTHWGGNDRVEDAAWRDRELARLETQLAPPKSEADLLAEANQRGYGWEEERKRMYRDFDYGALDRALDDLRVTDIDCYHALHLVFVYDWIGTPSALLEVAVEHGLLYLSDRLPDPLRFPPPHPAVVRIERKKRKLLSEEQAA